MAAFHSLLDTQGVYATERGRRKGRGGDLQTYAKSLIYNPNSWNSCPIARNKGCPFANDDRAIPEVLFDCCATVRNSAY